MDQPVTVRRFRPEDREVVLAVINRAAAWYRQIVPPEEVREPEMTPEELDAECRRMTWFCAVTGSGEVVGVMGLEYCRDVALLRHAYVLPAWQRRGVGGNLLAFIEAQVRGVSRVIAGTYAKNYQARALVEKHGYRLSPDSDAILRTYYAIPDARRESSVAFEKRLPPPPVG